MCIRDSIHATQEKDVYGIMMDVNCFKEINDTYGHGAGDRAIQEIGHIPVSYTHLDVYKRQVLGWAWP